LAVSQLPARAAGIVEQIDVIGAPWSLIEI